MRVLIFYFQNVFFTVGDRILQQRLGVPMGSPCSPALAIALCMHAEHLFLAPLDKSKFLGFRYMDDLLLLCPRGVSFPEIANIYPAPLSLQQEFPVDGRWEFLESELSFPFSGVSFDLNYFNKNWRRILAGLEPLRNCPHFSTCVPHAWQFGRVVGKLCRIQANSCGAKNTFLGAVCAFEEFSAFGASRSALHSAAVRMAYKGSYSPVWEAALHAVFLYVSLIISF